MLSMCTRRARRADTNFRSGSEAKNSWGDALRSSPGQHASCCEAAWERERVKQAHASCDCRWGGAELFRGFVERMLLGSVACKAGVQVGVGSGACEDRRA
mmetsp:Transcript_58182/g.140268  ORF Transcript_58182/g.140268 Transcript_58182/m.140268 type:complete len:100 (-) Transcript_58182:476-775(-)